MNLSNYIDRIRSDGKEAAAKWLLGQGINVIECWEENNYRHGYTYVTLNPELIAVLETHQYIGDKHFAEWVAIS